MRAVLLALLLSSPAAAADYDVSATARPQTVTIGDRVDYEAVITVPPSIRVAPAPTATLLLDWEVLELHPPAVKELKDGRSEYRFRAVLVAWSATTTAVPAMQFTATDPKGRTQTIAVTPIPIKVESVLARAGDKATDMRPPKGVVGYRSLLPYLIAAAVLALTGAAWWLWRRRARKLAAARGPAVPPRPAHETAREALAALLASGLLEAGRVKAFYIELSDILRRYLEGRFAIPALDRTTAELLPELRGRDAIKPSLAELKLFLETSDLVKFARFSPTESDISSDVARVRTFVDSTSPRPEPVPQAPAARTAARQGRP